MVSQAMGGMGAGVREGFERVRQAFSVTVSEDGTSKGTGNNSSTFGGKTQKTLTDQLKRMVGVDVGIGALLKQSQIFTGYLGNLFAIVGALIDTILAPLAPLAFKSLAKLGAIIPKVADMAGKHIPKILDWVEKQSKNVDKFFKSFLQKDYAGKILRALLWLVGINIAMRTIMLTGKGAATILGLRQGGVLNMAARGTSAIVGRGGGLGIGAAMAGLPLVGRRFFGGGGGAAAPSAAAPSGGRGGGWMGRIFGRGGASPPVPIRDATSPTGWRIPKGQPGGGNFAAAPTGGTGGGGFISRLFRRGGAPTAANMNAQWNANPRLAGGGRWQYPAGAVDAAGKNVGGNFAAGPAPGGAGVGRMSRIMGKFGNLAKMGKGIPILGTAISAAYGYSGGRDQGMSVGKSLGRSAATVGGAALLGAAGSVFGPAGTIIGAGIGAWGGGKIYDSLFGKGPKAGGSGPWNMDIGGIGAAGYRAPLFIAEAQEYWSEQVRKDGAVLDDHAIMLEVNKRMMEEEMKAREEEVKSLKEKTTLQEKIEGFDALAPPKSAAAADAEAMVDFEAQHIADLELEQKKAQAAKELQDRLDRLEGITLSEFDRADIEAMDKDTFKYFADLKIQQKELEDAKRLADIAALDHWAAIRQEESQTLEVAGQDYTIGGVEGAPTFAAEFAAMLGEYGMRDSGDISGLTPELLEQFRADRGELRQDLQTRMNIEKYVDAPIVTAGDLGGDVGFAAETNIDKTFTKARFTPAVQEAMEIQAIANAQAADVLGTQLAEAEGDTSPIIDWVKEAVVEGDALHEAGLNIVKEVIQPITSEIAAYKPPPVFKGMDIGDDDEGLEISEVGRTGNPRPTIQINFQDRAPWKPVATEIAANVWAGYTSGAGEEEPWNF